jgi:exopolysaccharide production protein ExoZ
VQINFAIQVLRALATIAVAATHFQMDFTHIVGPSSAFPFFMPVTRVAFDFFFLISGFVLVYSSESLFGTPSGPLIFFVRRLIRIIPLYWLATTTYVVLAFAVPSLGKTYSFESIIASYLFIPVPRLDGIMQPVVGQGWTLNYEMFFYFIFTLSVFARRRAAVVVASVLLIVAVVIGRVAPVSTAFDYWCQPIILEFIFGMSLGLAFREGIRIPAWSGWVLVALGLAIIILLPLEGDAYDEKRVLLLGVPAAMITGGATLGDLAKPSAPMRMMSVIGDASFSLYLFHSFPNRGILYLSVALGLNPAAAPWLYLTVALILGIAMSVVMYAVIEAPATRTLRRWLNVGSSREAARLAATAAPAPPLPDRKGLRQS